jgi:hypothetical protein
MYGLIIGVVNSIFQILTCEGMKTFKPKCLEERHHDVIGTWLLLEIDFSKDICSVPEVVKSPPIQTRVFNIKLAPKLLVCLNF